MLMLHQILQKYGRTDQKQYECSPNGAVNSTVASITHALTHVQDSDSPLVLLLTVCGPVWVRHQPHGNHTMATVCLQTDPPVARKKKEIERERLFSGIAYCHTASTISTLYIIYTGSIQYVLCSKDIHIETKRNEHKFEIFPIWSRFFH